MVAVTNVGLDDSWFGNHMSQANLYAFGRLAWNPDLSSPHIVDEWTRLTFGDDPKVVDTVTKLQLSSWRTYEVVRMTSPVSRSRNAHTSADASSKASARSARSIGSRRVRDGGTADSITCSHALRNAV